MTNDTAATKTASLASKAGRPDIAALREEYGKRRGAIGARLADFAAVPPEQYFYELVYCLLTPQSSAVNAGKVVEVFQTLDALHNDLPFAEILYRKEHYIRFHNTKAKRILEARAKMPQIAAFIATTGDNVLLREWLVQNVKGLGWKEASHFLRNIGRRNLAILDRHILKNLRKHGVLRELPRTLTKRNYLAIEEKFSRFAGVIGITMDELDLLFWSRETGQILK